MAFPTYNVAATSETTDSTSHSIPVDSSPSAGDGLLVLIACDGGSAVVPSWPSGFTEAKRNNSTTDFFTAALWKVATGSEGTAIAFTTDDAEKMNILCYRFTASTITAWSTSPPEFGTTSTGSGAAQPDPPSLTASWGAADNLWVAAYGATLTGPATASPSGFGTLRLGNTSGGAGTTNTHYGAAEKQDAVATLNPGAFAKTGSATWFCNLAVIRPTSALTIGPAGPTISITAGDVAVASIQAVAPDGPTLAITAGSVTVNETLAPEGPTLSITPGSITVNETLLFDGPTLTITPGAVTVDIPVVLVPTGIGFIQDTTNAATYNTSGGFGSGTIAASATGNVVIAVVSATRSSGTPPTPTLINHSALPFELLTATAGTNPTVDAATNPNILAFYGCISTGTTADDVDVSFGGTTMVACLVSFYQVTGFATPPADIADVVSQLELATFASDVQTSLTLDAFAETSDIYVFAVGGLIVVPAEDLVPEASATQIHDLGVTSPNRGLLTTYKANDTTPSATWTTASTGIAGALVFDSTGAAGAQAITPAPVTLTITAGTVAVAQVQAVVPVGPTLTITPGTALLTATSFNHRAGAIGSSSASQDFTIPAVAGGGVLWVSVYTRNTSAAPTPTLTASGATFTLARSQASTDTFRRTSVFWSQDYDAGPLTITANHGVPIVVAIWSADEQIGGKTSGDPVTQSNSAADDTSPFETTLASGTGEMLVATGFSGGASHTATPGSGTELFELNSGGSTKLHVYFDTAVNIAPSVTVASSPTLGTIVAIEAALAVSHQNIALAGPTVTITAGTVAVTTPQVLIAVPVIVTITAGAPAVAVEQAIAPIGPTVTITPGTVAVSVVTVAQNIAPAAVTLTVTAGTVAIAQEQAVTLTPPTVAILPGDVLVTIPVAQDLTLAVVTLSILAGTLEMVEVHLPRDPFVVRWPVTRRGFQPNRYRR